MRLRLLCLFSSQPPREARGMLVGRLLLLPAIVLALAACGGEEDTAQTETNSAPTTAEASVPDCAPVAPPEPKPDGGQKAPSQQLEPDVSYRLVVETNCGSFTIELDQSRAPKTAASLVSLARNGFYDRTTFHRVVPGFVIQGGDPTGTGTGGPGYQTVDPPPRTAAYTKGVVAMAKTAAEPAGTAGSQFFVVTGADIGLPAEYAIVGEVTEGLDAVEAIEALGTGDGPPSMTVAIQRISVEQS